MILADKHIQYRLDKGDLVITPRPTLIQPASVDLHLGDTYQKRPSRHVLDPSRKDLGLIPPPVSFTEYILAPFEFLNFSTGEWVEIPSDLVAVLSGKSSLARLGLQIECAGYVDPGWKGRLTIEVVNLSRNSIILRPGMPICQIRFERLSGSPDRLYGDPALDSHYQHSHTVVGPRFTVPPAE